MTRKEQLLFKYVEENNIVMAAYILKRKVNVNVFDMKGNSALMFVKSREMLDLLVSYNIDVNAANFNRETPLSYARNAQVVKGLIENGADLNAIDKKGDTALIKYAKRLNGDIEPVLTPEDFSSIWDVLKEYGVKSTYRNFNNKTARDYIACTDQTGRTIARKLFNHELHERGTVSRETRLAAVLPDGK